MADGVRGPEPWNGGVDRGQRRCESPRAYRRGKAGEDSRCQCAAGWYDWLRDRWRCGHHKAGSKTCERAPALRPLPRSPLA